MRSPRPAVIVVTLLLSIILLPSSARSQKQSPSNERGLNASAYAADSIDNVNLFNGNLSLTIPIGSTYNAGGPLSYGLKLYYNSNVWDFRIDNRPSAPTGQDRQALRADPDPAANAGVGWRLSFGELYAPDAPHNEEGRWVYVSPDGSRHKFFDTLNGKSDGGHKYTHDNTYLRLDASDPTSPRIHFPNGQIHTFNNAARRRVERIDDVWGNYLVIDMSNRDGDSLANAVWTIRDKHHYEVNRGREHKIQFDQHGLVDYVELAVTPEGEARRTAVYDFVYAESSFTRHWKDRYHVEGSVREPASGRFLTRINLPDAAGSYAFDYYKSYGGTETMNDSGMNSGAVEWARLPTGGKYRWEYGRYGFFEDFEQPSSAVPMPEIEWAYGGSEGVRKKEIYNMHPSTAGQYVLDGVYSYAQTLCMVENEFGHPGRPYTKTTVVTPEQDKIVNYFNSAYNIWDYGLPYVTDTGRRSAFPGCENDQIAGVGGMSLSQELYEYAGSAGHKLKRREYVKYVSDPAATSGWLLSTERDINRRLLRRRTEYLDDRQFDGKRVFRQEGYADYDGLGHYRSTTVTGNFKLGPEDARTTFVNYNPGGGTYHFDNATGAGTDNFRLPTGPWLLETYDRKTESEGNRSSQRTYCFQNGLLYGERVLHRGTDERDTDVVIKYARDGSGLVTEEAYFGGDLRGADSAGRNLCSFDSAGAQYHLRYGYTAGVADSKEYAAADESSFLPVFGKQIDTYTGLPLSEEDASGVKTDFKYDLLNRLVENRPTSGNGAKITYDYDAANPDGSGAKAATLTQTSFSTGTAESVLTQHVTRYDSYGRVAAEEEDVPTSATGTRKAVRTRSYNAMGWVKTVSEKMDGTNNTLPTQFTRYEDYDAFGRATRIRPPAGAEVRMIYGGDRSVTHNVSRLLAGQTQEARTERTEVKDFLGRVWKLTEKKTQSLAQATQPASVPVNYAGQGKGGAAQASTQINASFPPAAANDGERTTGTGHEWGTPGGGWNDATQGEYGKDWIQVNFGGPQTVGSVEVVTLRDNPQAGTSAPSEFEEFSTSPDSGYGVTDFDVQYQSGHGWVTVASVEDNNKLVRRFTFTPVETSAVRVVVRGAAEWNTAPMNYSRIVEIEAYNTSGVNVAGRYNGGKAVASSCANGLSPCRDMDDPNFPPEAVIDGDKSGQNWGGGLRGGWNDGTEGEFAGDWLSVAFDDEKTIHEINVVTLRDNPGNTAPVSADETFSTAPNTGFGITSFEVQYLSDGRWVRAPGGLVTNNNKVWRKLTLGSPVTTSAVRVVVWDAALWTQVPSNYSRIVELEAVGLEDEGEDADKAANNVHTYYTYDIGNRAATVTLENESSQRQTRTFSYDNRGFLEHETHPENGTTTYGGYDARGHARRKYLGGGGDQFDLTTAYDRAERVAQIRETGGAQRVLKEFFYGNGATAANRSRGKLETAVRHNYHAAPWNRDVTVTETYTYGGVGGRASHRKTEVALAASQTFNQSFEYDDLGRLSKLAYPSCSGGEGNTCNQQNPARRAAYGYTRDYLTSIGEDTNGSLFYVNRITYHPNGLAAEIKFPADDPTINDGNISWKQANDPNSMARPRSISTAGLNANWGSGDYAYDGAGNITSIGNNTYRYDALGRLAASTVVGTVASSGSWAQSVTYDDFGNVTKVVVTPPNTAATERTLPASAATNRLTSRAYDAAGNETENGTYRYAYDGFNMLRTFRDTSTTTPQNVLYVYTAGDERVLAYDAQNNKKYWKVRDLGNNVLREWQVAGTQWAWAKDYVHNGRNTLASLSADGQTRYFILDHLGTPRTIARKNRTREENHNYLPFGEEAVTSAGGAEPIRFTGHERDSHGAGTTADDLDYMHARYYSSRNARFTSVDPVLNDSMSGAAGWSRYSYVRNNPINAFDPDGRESKKHQASVSTRFNYPSDLNGDGKVTDHEINVYWRVLVMRAEQGDEQARLAIRDHVVAVDGPVGALFYGVIGGTTRYVSRQIAATVGDIAVIGGFKNGTQHYIGKAGFNALDIQPTWLHTWARNQRWLTNLLDAGQKIRVVTNPAAVRLESYFRKELKDLHRRFGTAKQLEIEGIQY